MATRGFLPDSDAGLLAWSANFSSYINQQAQNVGLTTQLASGYAQLHIQYANALAAADPAIRTKQAVSNKNAARTALKKDARLLAKLVEGTAGVNDGQKIALGLTVRKTPTPVPAPTSAPGLDVISVNAWQVKIKLHDSATSSKRGKPVGVSGASVFSFVGEAAPSDIALWQFEGNTGRTIFDVKFPNTVAPGAKVWMTAFWFNGRKQSGPACAPVGANLQFGGMSKAA